MKEETHSCIQAKQGEIMAMSSEQSSIHGIILDLSGCMQTEINVHAIKRSVKDTRAHAMLDAVTAIVKKESEQSANSMMFTVAYGVNCGNIQTVDLLSAGSALKGLQSGVGAAAALPWTQAEMQPQVPPGPRNIALYGQANLPCADNSQIEQLAAAMGLSPEDPSLAEMFSNKMSFTQSGGFNDRLEIEKQATIGNSQIEQLAAAMGLSPEDPSLAEMFSNKMSFTQSGGFNDRLETEKQATIGNSQIEQLAAAMGLSPEDPSLAEMFSNKMSFTQSGGFNDILEIEKQATIGNILAAHQNPQPRLMREVSKELYADNVSNKLHGYLAALEPYIYGGAAMCEALRLTLNVFKSCRQKRKILVIISGGQPTDGDPLHSGLIAQLKQEQVLIISCLLTSNGIESPRELYSKPQESWSLPAKLMFQISSNVSNQKLPRSLLAARGWRLPQNGTSNLFLQANHPDVINEFTTLFTSLETNVDALVNILGQIKIDDILNTRLHELECQKREPQIGRTCYAHSIATVIFLATKRIVGYDETRPSIEAYMKKAPLEFLTLLGHIIEEFSIHGANTENVLRKVAPIFWFHAKQISENEAREALNQQRPLVARFSLYGNQWDAFEKFWDGPNYKRIMNACDLPAGNPNTPYGGHAVTLISIEGGALKLLNSWGSCWADRGFFRIADGSVLGMEFFDVFYDEESLTQIEQNAWIDESKILAKDLSNFFPSCGEVLKYQCPKCMSMSFLKDFGGDFVEAQCPVCKQMFTTAGGNLEILQALYYRDN